MKHPKRRKLLSRAWMGFFAYGSMVSCLVAPTGSAAKVPTQPTAITEAAAQPADTSSVIASRLAPGTTAGAFAAQDRDEVAAFYAAREFRPVWVDERGP